MTRKLKVKLPFTTMYCKSGPYGMRANVTDHIVEATGLPGEVRMLCGKERTHYGRWGEVRPYKLPYALAYAFCKPCIRKAVKWKILEELNDNGAESVRVPVR